MRTVMGIDSFPQSFFFRNPVPGHFKRGQQQQLASDSSVCEAILAAMLLLFCETHEGSQAVLDSVPAVLVRVAIIGKRAAPINPASLPSRARVITVTRGESPCALPA